MPALYLVASFGVCRGIQHALFCLPLSFRGATYGVFTPYPMLSGVGLERQGEILRKAAALADEGKLKPLLNAERFSTADLDAAYAAVESGSTGKRLWRFAICRNKGKQKQILRLPPPS